MDKYIMESSYMSLTMEKSRQDANMTRFFNACMMLNESTIDIRSLNEAVGDNAKNLWQRFIAFIKKISAQFSESMNKLFASETGWLEKYKEIILTKKPADFNITDMPDYSEGIKRIGETTVPILQYSTMKDKLDSRDEFIKYACSGISAHLTTYFPEGTDNHLTEGFKKYFVGGEPREVQMDQLNFTDMYNFCYQHDKLLDYISKDEKAIISSSHNAEEAIKAAIEASDVQETKADNIQTADSGKPKEEQINDGSGDDSNLQDNEKHQQTQLTKFTTSDGKQFSSENSRSIITDEISGRQSQYDLAKNVKSSEGKTKQEKTIADQKMLKMKQDIEGLNKLLPKDKQVEFKESFIDPVYRNNYALYNIINEELKVHPDSGTKSSSVSSSSTANTNQSLNRVNQQNIGGKKDDDAQHKQTATDAINDNDNNAQNALEQVQTRIGTYNNIVQSIFSAKSSAVTEIYKGYMDILRAHVRSVVGKEDETTDIVAKGSSDYAQRIYNKVRMDDLYDVQQAYAANANDTTLNNYVSTVIKIYGQTQWNNAFLKHEKNRNATADYFYKQFAKGYTAAHPEDTKEYLKKT